MPSMLDVVVGAGPNGLTAAVELARRGHAVEVFEAREAPGGGARTEELTLPGFRHDPCSAAHPLGAGSPAFNAMPLERHGLTWLHPELPMAHPFPDGTAAVLARSVGETAMSLGARDAGAYRRLVAPFVGRWEALAADFLRTPWLGRPRDPATWARFGSLALQPAALLARRFHQDRARGLLAGLAWHAVAPLRGVGTGGLALMFAFAAHAVGWPIARGGSQAVTDALVAYLRELGGAVHTHYGVKRLDNLPPARAYVFDTSPTALARIAGLGDAYRGFRYGPAVFKIDYALDGPVPWTAAEARRAGTVHVGPALGEIDGKHTFWAYGHVPSGWRGDATEVIERQLERFPPGFRNRVLGRAVAGPPELAARNANYVGGDIACGAFTGLQTVLRPKLARVPYATAHPAIFLCSSAHPARSRRARHVGAPRGARGVGRAARPVGPAHGPRPVLLG